ncbi:MAG: TonB family protein [Xanthomonadales bacterium]|nr:TonB family protein [Xanthomonadales bacterium]
MTSHELLHLLADTAVAGSLGILAVLTLRRFMRRHFGAGVGYATWCLVPMTLFAAAWPVRILDPAMIEAVSVLAATSQLAHVGVSMLPAQTSPELGTWILSLWLIGAILWAGRMVVAQQRFRRGLGTLQASESMFVAQSRHAGLPATLGVWRPQIILPADFNTRYDADQRALMLAHERQHIAHGDPWANALASALRCVFWFNPLFHVAIACMRQDQELACDAAVLAQQPRARRRYGQALLQAQMAGMPVALGCHFGFCHPLKERILMLRQTPASRARRLVGTGVLFVLIASLSATVLAAQSIDSTQGLDRPEPVASKQQRRQFPPRYPVDAIRQRISGSVVLLVDVNAKGQPVGIAVDQSTPEGVFDAATIKAVSQWTFEPAMKNGVAVAGRVRVPISFQMNKDADAESANQQQDAGAQ